MGDDMTIGHVATHILNTARKPRVVDENDGGVWRPIWVHQYAQQSNMKDIMREIKTPKKKDTAT